MTDLDKRGHTTMITVKGARTALGSLSNGGCMSKKCIAGAWLGLVAALGLAACGTGESDPIHVEESAEADVGEAQSALCSGSAITHRIDTQTKCIFFTKWCDYLYACADGRHEWTGWENCGTC
jgi:hypothetical protein